MNKEVSITLEEARQLRVDLDGLSVYQMMVCKKLLEMSDDPTFFSYAGEKMKDVRYALVIELNDIDRILEHIEAFQKGRG